MGKLEANKKIKRDSLLESAFSLFTSKGINKTSVADIVEKSGVAKGTFYLYFKDKYDLKNRLIAHKASQLFHKAYLSLSEQGISDLYSEIIYITDNVIDQFVNDKSLLLFISKNLSWGIFKDSLINPIYDEDVDFYDLYNKLVNRDDCKLKDPEIMVFMIIELISSTCYSSILYSEPVDIDKLKPYLYSCIRGIISEHIVE